MKTLTKLEQDILANPQDYVVAIRKGKTVYIHKSVRERNNKRKKEAIRQNKLKELENELLQAELLEEKLKDKDKLFEHFMEEFTEGRD